MQLSPIAERFVHHWGDMGNAWGVNRTVAQIHALLFFHGRPLNADEICETLGAARSNVSNSLKELLNWNLIRSSRKSGDRREYFEAPADVWEIFRVLAEERRRREIEPTLSMLRNAGIELAIITGRESPLVAQRACWARWFRPLALRRRSPSPSFSWRVPWPR